MSQNENRKRPNSPRDRVISLLLSQRRNLAFDDTVREPTPSLTSHCCFKKRMFQQWPSVYDGDEHKRYCLPLRPYSFSQSVASRNNVGGEYDERKSVGQQISADISSYTYGLLLRGRAIIVQDRT